MSEEVKNLIASLEEKGLLDKDTTEHLRKRLRKRLKIKGDEQQNEISLLKEELVLLKLKLSI